MREHIIGHKTDLNKFKKIEIISSIFLDSEGLKLEKILKEKTQKHSNLLRLKSILLNNEWVNNEIMEKMKKFLETNEHKHATIKNLWDIIKILEDNIGRKNSDISYSNIFIEMSPRVRDTKERINKWYYIKFKSFCTAKENISTIKRETSIWENISAKDT